VDTIPKSLLWLNRNNPIRVEMILKPFEEFKIQSIYELLENVYTTSDSMSESFDEKFSNLNTCQKYFEEMLNLPGVVVVFAEISGQLAGFLIIKPRHQANIRHTSELNMGVHSEYRNKGVGKFLLENALKLAKDSIEIEIVYLMVRGDNISAIRLYQNFGFEQMVILDKDTKIGNTYYDGILMRKFVS
jgi:ribosomal protein S18 acetylase RimI-like enzyme